MPKTIPENLATYTERSEKMTEKERQALRVALKKSCSELRKVGKSLQQSWLKGINCSLEVGRQVELFTSKEKLTMIGFDSMSPAMRDGFPDASLEFAKRCLSLHQKYPEGITDWKVARVEWYAVEEMLFDIPANERGPQILHPHEPVKDFVAKVQRATAELNELMKEMPIEKWEPFLVESFLREAEPIVKLVAQLNSDRHSDELE